MSSISTMSFPVFKIGYEKPLFEKGVSFFLFVKNTIDDEEYEITFVDDRNRKELTLGRRRLGMQTEGKILKKIGSAIFFIGDFIKIAKPGIWFIDSNGKVFDYKKQVRVPLVFKRITQIINIPAGGAIICVEGMNTRFKVLYAPTSLVTHAGLLVLNNSHLLYGIYDREYKNTTRMI